MKDIRIVLDEVKEEGEVHLNDVPELVSASYDVVAIGELLDFVDAENRLTVLTEILTLLNYGGQIEIHGNDIVDISRAIHYGQLPPEQALQYLYGNNRRSITHITAVINELWALGLKITVKQLNPDLHHYFVVGCRSEATKN